MKWVGLTGGIATGKSTVEKLIQSLGFPVIDADQVAHGVVGPGSPGLTQVLSHFGKDYQSQDGSLNRKKMGDLVFLDHQAKLQLENIVHPLVQNEVQKQRQALQQNGSTVCFYSVPLLFEKSLQKQFEAIVTVWCDPELQLKRLMRRNHLTETEALTRIHSQLPIWQKIKQSNFCLDNSTDLSELEIQVTSLLKKHFS